jgi:predicted TIM-barrel fold metal-dependent hydrolase
MTEVKRDAWANYVDEAWLAARDEPVIDADLLIIDPHHHLWKLPFDYELPALLKDLGSGHKVIATVHTEAHGHYRKEGPDHLKPVGETEYLVDAAEAAARIPGAPKVCAGITGGGDLTADAGMVAELLDAHIAAGKGRFRGIRANVLVTFEPATARMILSRDWETVLDRPGFRAGVQCLARRSLTLDLVCLHQTLPAVARLAERESEVAIVVNHLAPPADFSAQPASESDLYAAWRRGIDAIAAQPNVYLKLGGCANPSMSLSMPAMRALRERSLPPTSDELAAVYRPLVDYAIDRFGPSRCMFESNFPADKAYTSYRVVWNAFKRLAQRYTATERRALFSGTAAKAYRLVI